MITALHASHAFVALHNNPGLAILCAGGQTGEHSMEFLTELLSRPRPNEQARYRAALAILNAMSNSDRADIGIKPADFPRIAREMAER
jgi:uncharacterized protein YjiS (DUF1127 family)